MSDNKLEIIPDYMDQLSWLETKTETVLLSDLKECNVDIRCAYKQKRLKVKENTK